MWETVREAKVRLRGWDYPHLSSFEQECRHGQGFIESWCSGGRYQEYWKFFGSGQFVHLFAYRENDPAFAAEIERNLDLINRSLDSVTGYLSITSSVWTLTELYEFIARLSSTGIFDSGICLTVELRNVKGRALGFSEWERSVHGLYTTASDTIPFEREHTLEEVLSATKSLAVDAAINIFDGFGAMFGRSVIEDIQAGLYSRGG